MVLKVEVHKVFSRPIGGLNISQNNSYIPWNPTFHPIRIATILQKFLPWICVPLFKQYKLLLVPEKLFTSFLHGNDCKPLSGQNIASRQHICNCFEIHHLHWELCDLGTRRPRRSFGPSPSVQKCNALPETTLLEGVRWNGSRELLAGTSLDAEPSSTEVSVNSSNHSGKSCDGRHQCCIDVLNVIFVLVFCGIM